MEPENEFANWVSLYTERLVRVACMYTRDLAAAEDHVQDAYIKAYKSMHQLSQRDRPFPWLVRIVINECKTASRKSWLEMVTSIFPNRAGGSTEDNYILHSELREVHKAVLSLPEKYKIPIALYYFEELPIPQIAEVMRIRPNTVKTRLSRGRQRLGMILKETEGDHEPGREIVRC